MKKRLFLYCCFVIQYAIQYAQGQKLPEIKRDSIRAVLQQLPNDTNKVLTLLEYANRFIYSNESLSIPFIDSAMKLAEKLHWQKGVARANLDMGRAVGDTGNNIASNDYILTAIEIDKKRGDEKAVAKDLSLLARAYNRESDFPNALRAGLESMDIAERLHDDTLMAGVVGNIVITYLNHRNYPKGTEWALKAKAMAEKVNSRGDLVDALQHLAFIRFHDKKKPEVKALLRQALEIAKTLNEPATEADVLSQLGEAEADSPAVALGHLNTARKIYTEISPNGMRFANTLTLLGVIYEDTAYRNQGNPDRRLLDSAIAVAGQAVEILKRNNNRQYLSMVYDRLAQYESEVGHFEKAYDYDLKAAVIYDSLYSQKKKVELSDLQSKHDLEIKDTELLVHRIEAADRQRILISLAVGIALLAVIGILLLRQSRQRQKTSSTLMVLNKKLEEANKVKARFFGILSHDLRSPVANLLGFLHLVKNDPGSLSPNEQAGHQADIARSAEELLETMEAMLFWSKEQMDSFKPDIRQIPVAVLFAYLRKFFGAEKDVSLRFSNPDSLTLSGDENYLRVIMQNLTSNALKALKNNPAGIVEWKAVRKGDKTILSVTDNGPGLDQAQAAALFTDVVSVNGRSGFGFQLIRDLAKAIQYRISVKSESGKGTTFVLQS